MLEFQCAVLVAAEYGQALRASGGSSGKSCASTMGSAAATVASAETNVAAKSARMLQRISSASKRMRRVAIMAHLPFRKVKSHLTNSDKAKLMPATRITQAF
jgi:hypothetical protein